MFSLVSINHCGSTCNGQGGRQGESRLLFPLSRRILAYSIKITDFVTIVLPQKFRFKPSKTTKALSVKIDRKTLSMTVDEELDGSIEEIAEELPENAPRYLVLSHALVCLTIVLLASPDLALMFGAVTLSADAQRWKSVISSRPDQLVRPSACEQS